MVYGWVRYVPLPSRRIGLFQRRAERSSELARRSGVSEVPAELRGLRRKRGQRTASLREDLKDEAFLVRSKVRWILATISFLTAAVTIGVVEYDHGFVGFLHLLTLALPWYAALGKRVWIRSAASAALLILAAAIMSLYRLPVLAAIVAGPAFVLLMLSGRVRGRGKTVGTARETRPRTPPEEIRLRARPRSKFIRERFRQAAVLSRARIFACLLTWGLLAGTYITVFPRNYRLDSWTGFVLPAAMILPPAAAWAKSWFLRFAAALLLAGVAAGVIMTPEIRLWGYLLAAAAGFLLYLVFKTRSG